MTEVEDPWGCGERMAHLHHRRLQRRASHQQQHRVEVALEDSAPAKARDSKSERYRRVEPYRIHSGLGDITLVKHSCGARKADDRTSRITVFEKSNDPRRRPDHPA